jgi:hypothetical protein
MTNSAAKSIQWQLYLRQKGSDRIVAEGFLLQRNLCNKMGHALPETEELQQIAALA